MKKIVFLWREKTGIWGVCILWIPFYAFFGLLGGRFFFYPLWSVFSGKYWEWLNGIFWKPFPKECAGTCLDQSTVGKFFFWYTVLTVFAFTFAVVVRALTNMQNKSHRRVYLIFFILAVGLTMSFLLWPATLLAHYIIDLGMTPKRLSGIIYLGISVLVWPVLGWLLLRTPKTRTISQAD